MKNVESYPFYVGDKLNEAPSLDLRREKLSHWIEQYLPAKGRVLDLGCWDGSFLKMLPPTWAKWGVDLQRHPDLPGEVKFLAGNLEKEFPVEDDSFDLVFAGEIIEHVLATTLFLERCYHIVKPGGYLILTTPNLACWLNLWRWLTLGQFWCVNSDVGQDGHVRYLAPVTLRTSVARVGFEIIEMTSSGGLEFLRCLPPAYKLISRIFSMRGKNLLALVRKPLLNNC
jgi:SAM-dependent methyltransferase